MELRHLVDASIASAGAPGGALAQRRRQDEWMDDPQLAADSHRAALRGLQRLNAVSRSWRLLWPQIAATARKCAAGGGRLRVMDVATGSGDGPLAMARRARFLGLPIDWVLCDRSGVALDAARRAATCADVAVALEQVDLLHDQLPPAADLVTCSLFLHHLDEEDAVRALRRMADAARVGIGVADLSRSRVGLSLAWIASRALTRSPVVHTDAVRSVRAAFTKPEAEALAVRAGLLDTAVRGAWPERWVLWWWRGVEENR